MKPKEYVKKYHLEETTYFNHADFISDFTADFMTVVQFLQEKNQLNYERFQTVIKEIRSKWDGISNKCKGTGLPESLWKYFYASVIVKVRDEFFGDFLQKKKEVQEEKQREWRRMHSCRFDFDPFEDMRRRFMRELFSGMFNFRLSVPHMEFQILELSSSASEGDVKDSYRKLSLKHHPDKGGSRDMFEKITEAKNKCLNYISSNVS